MASIVDARQGALAMRPQIRGAPSAAAHASQHANRDHEQIAREILGEADAVDRERREPGGLGRRTFRSSDA